MLDIAIIGGGIAGASAAYHLARHRSVVLLERESALGYHASGRSAAEFAFRFHSPPVAKLAAISFDFLTAPPDDFTEIKLLKQRGNLLIANAEKAARLAAVFAAENTPMSRLERLTVAQAIERAPILNPDFVADAFYDPDCWDIEADGLLQAFAKGARAAGAAVRTGVELTGARREGGAWVLETTAGEIRARIVVNAAGAWADTVGQICGAGHLSIKPYRRTAITVDVPGFDVGALPEICEIDEAFYMKPEAGKLMVSPADATESHPCDARPEELDIAYAAHYLEQATTVRVQHVLHSWAGLRSFAPDRLPAVGWSGRMEGFFWLAGQGGYGIQTAPALGELATTLLVAGSGSPPLDDLGPEFSPRRLERE